MIGIDFSVRIVYKKMFNPMRFWNRRLSEGAGYQYSHRGD